MAKVIITIEDSEEDPGLICVGVEFDPPPGDADEATPAQIEAVRMITNNERIAEATHEALEDLE